MTEWNQLHSDDGVVALAANWYELDLERKTASKISDAYLDHGWSFDSRPNTSAGLLVWTKSRLLERGLFRALAIDTCVEPLIAGRPDVAKPVSRCKGDRSLEEAVYIYQEMQRRQFARSGFSRSILSVIEPIDRVAQRVTGIEDHTRCRECGMRFRNSAAHRLHLVESHGVRA